MPADDDASYLRLARGLFKVVALVLILIAVNHGIAQLRASLDIDIRPSNEDTIHRVIMIVAVLYTLALAMPFVPGAEIGLGLITILGVDIVPLVYLCTIIGLGLAFCIGSLIPASVLAKLAHDLHLTRVSTLLTRFANTPSDQRLDLLMAPQGREPLRALAKFRYLALGIALNVPGNFMIGGGGGICMMAGMSKLFSPLVFILTIMIAVSPLPIALMVFGPAILSH